MTSLRERGNFLVAGVRRGSTTLSGGGRRRLVLPPIDAELWQRVVREEERRRREGGHGEDPEAEGAGEDAGGEDDDDQERVEQWRPWGALKRLLKGGSAHAHSGRRRRRNSTPPTRRQPINRECLPLPCARGFRAAAPGLPCGPAGAAASLAAPHVVAPEPVCEANRPTGRRSGNRLSLPLSWPLDSAPGLSDAARDGKGRVA